MIEQKHVGNGYYAYPCPRCIGGTMAYEQDKLGTPPYQKCILCGTEVIIPVKFKKSGINAGNPPSFETRPKGKPRNKREKRAIKDYRWKFSQSQPENKR